MKDYQPISCDFYDILEATAVRRIPSTVVYYDEGGVEQTVEGLRISDLKTQNKSEFVIFDNGLRIRLDRLVSLNDRKLDGSCSIGKR